MNDIVRRIGAILRSLGLASFALILLALIKASPAAAVPPSTCERLFLSSASNAAKFKANFGINYLASATVSGELPPVLAKTFKKIGTEADAAFQRYLKRNGYNTLEQARMAAQALLSNPRIPVATNGKLNPRITPNVLRASFADRMRSLPQPPVEIRYIRAIKGRGVFATEKIPKGTLIGEYAGIIRVMDMTGDLQNMYLMQTSFTYRRLPVIIDGESSGNFGRFLNHSSLPVTSANGSNAIFSELFLDGRPRFAIFATRDIEVGEQVLINYGDEYWNGLGVDPTLFK